MIELVSDVEGFVLDPVSGVFIVETGTIQNVASVTWTLRDSSTVVDSIGFISDVSEVPASRDRLARRWSHRAGSDPQTGDRTRTAGLSRREPMPLRLR
jgi:hypothetical protein